MFNGKCSISARRLRFALTAGLFLAVFAAYPQMKLWYLQGAEWNGHYAYNDIDEVAYAAYLKALIDGRPRKNDPYTGRDESPSTPRAESLFSIQFAAPYAVALPARLLGISAAASMTISGIIAGFLTGFLCFYLIGFVTGAGPSAALAASLAVLCGGALAAGEGAIGEILGTGFPYPYFPFLRRYVPAVSFPVFFGLLISVWFLLRPVDLKKRWLPLMAAAACFSFLVFSYFYVWTAAAAFLFVVFILLALIRPEGWLDDVKALSILAAICLVPLVLYGLMLSDRAAAMDRIQLLVRTRQPDIWRFPEYIGVAALIFLAIGVALRRINLRSVPAVFVAALSVVPFVLFNQQVITGRSLQPIHYQVFIGNYVAALAFAGSVCLFFRGELKKGSALTRVLTAVAVVSAAAWGFVECHYTVRVLDEANVARDNGIPLALQLKKIAAAEPDPARSTVFAVTNIFADDSPTLTPQNVLWSRHQHIFTGLSWQESKERYYRYLYYQSLDENWLRERLKAGDFVSMIALFGWGRHTNRLSKAARPLTLQEVEEESGRYGEFIRRFSIEEASDPTISLVVVPAGWNTDLGNLRKWYTLGEGKTIGGYVLYRAALRDKP